jgi:chaperonin GroES
MARPKPKAKAKPKGKVKSKKPASRSAGRPPAKAPKAKASGRPASKVARRSATKAPAGIRPVKDRVVVKRVETAEEKVGSLYVPDSAREKPLEAEVVAVGSGRILKSGAKVPLQLKPGDRVLVGKWSGSEVRLGDVDYLILREEEILGILG